MDRNEVIIFIDLKFAVLKKLYAATNDYITYLALQMIVDINTKLEWNMRTDDIKIFEELVKTSYLDMKKTINFGDTKLSDIVKKTIERAFQLFARYEPKYTDYKDRINNIIDGIFKGGQFKSYYLIKEGFHNYVEDLKSRGYKVINYLVTYRAYKQALVKKLFSVIPELASLNIICLNNTYELKNLIATTQNNKRNFILTFKPFTLLPNMSIKTDFIYFCSETINYVKKAKIEEKIMENSIMFEICCISQLLSAIEFIKEKEKSLNSMWLKVGYWVSTKKHDKMQKLHRCFNSKFPIYFIPLDMRFALNRNIDVFLHKIIDVSNLNDPYSLMRLENFKVINKKNKEILIFDNPKDLDVCTNRIIFHQKIAQILESQNFIHQINSYFNNNPNSKKFNVKLPEQLSIDPAKELPSFAKKLVNESKDIKYPVILKTQNASHTDNSNIMAVAADDEGLLAAENSSIFRKEPHIIQRLINHEERLIKIFVLGEKIFISQRQSLPIKGNAGYGTSYFFFDSQKPFSECVVLKNKLNFKESPDIINVDVILLITNLIQDEISMTIYGIDIIKEKNTGDYFILNLTYFPDFKEVENFDELLRDHLWDNWKEKNNKAVIVEYNC